MTRPAHPSRAAAAPDVRGERPIVLVHGAWAGEWCWELVVPRLAASGRPVHCVSLRGHGARSDENGPHVTLGDHVDDVVALFDERRLSGATLVGHSYGGRVITKAWPRVRTRADELVYLDAHAPVGPRDDTDAGASYPRDDRGMIPLARFVPGDDLFDDSRRREAFYARLMPQSPATLRESFWVDLPDDVDKTYVHATAEPSSRFQSYAAAARADPSWSYVEVPATHWLMYSHPELVASIILGDATESDSDPRDTRENQ